MLGVPVVHASHAGFFQGFLMPDQREPYESHFQGETVIVDGHGQILARMAYEDGKGCFHGHGHRPVPHAFEWVPPMRCYPSVETDCEMRRCEVFERILLGVGRRMVPVPECLFRTMVQRDARRLAKRPTLEPDERRVQHFAVREIPRRREAIAPEVFADELDLTLDEMGLILDELERRMTFLCRRGGDDVVWAYPVTAAETPHQVRMDGGEACSAA